MVEHATGASEAVPVSERFFLAAILLYVLLALALTMHVAQMFAGPVTHVGMGRVAVAGWPASGGW